VVVHLIDGTYELFRHFLSPAAAFDRSAPEELRAVRGVVASVLGMLEGGVTHLGVATDHVIESFRNALWPGDKTGEGLDPLLSAQFQPLEDALSALGVVVWPMVEFEADDALAAARADAGAPPGRGRPGSPRTGSAPRPHGPSGPPRTPPARSTTPSRRAEDPLRTSLLDGLEVQVLDDGRGFAPHQCGVVALHEHEVDRPPGRRLEPGGKMPEGRRVARRFRAHRAWPAGAIVPHPLWAQEGHAEPTPLCPSYALSVLGLTCGLDVKDPALYSDTGSWDGGRGFMVLLGFERR
jgi:hypothetical protein